MTTWTKPLVTIVNASAPVTGTPQSSTFTTRRWVPLMGAAQIAIVHSPLRGTRVDVAERHQGSDQATVPAEHVRPLGDHLEVVGLTIERLRYVVDLDVAAVEKHRAGRVDPRLVDVVGGGRAVGGRTRVP